MNLDKMPEFICIKWQLTAKCTICNKWINVTEYVYILQKLAVNYILSINLCLLWTVQCSNDWDNITWSSSSAFHCRVVLSSSLCPGALQTSSTSDYFHQNFIRSVLKMITVFRFFLSTPPTLLWSQSIL